MVVPTLTPLLGFPLMIHPIGSTLHSAKGLYNQRAYHLFLDIDVSKKSLGIFATLPVTENIAVEQRDGKDLKDTQLVSLINFINMQVGVALLEWSTTSAQKKAAVMTHLAHIIRPRTFYEYFECQRDLLGNEVWEGTEKPVRITDEEMNKPICGTCFAMDWEDGKPLLKCGACGKAAYCSKACQKLDGKEGDASCK